MDDLEAAFTGVSFSPELLGPGAPLPPPLPPPPSPPSERETLCAKSQDVEAVPQSAILHTITWSCLNNVV